MTLALEQARSIFTGWIRSCVSCLSLGEGNRDGRQQNEREREKEVCDSQPRLITPMTLRVYDDLPSGHQPRNSVSSWFAEGRNFAARASTRARRKSKRISGPSDFRIVQSYHPPPTQFQPLELSIYRSGNQLSRLPSFKSFQLEDDKRQTLAAPPRALSHVSTRPRRCQSTHAAFHVPRKPVGSAERRPENSEVPVRITSTLIPHFSIVHPIDVLPPQDEPPRIHERSRSLLVKEWPSRAADKAQAPWGREPRTLSIHHRVKSEPATKQSIVFSSNKASQISSLRRGPSLTNGKPAASLSSRVTGWFTNKTSTTTQTPISVPYKNTISLPYENSPPSDRQRTLSGSTVATTTTTITGGITPRPTNPSTSSTFTNSTSHTSVRRPSPPEKDLEAGISLAATSNPPAKPEVIPLQPTIYENQQQQQYPSLTADDTARYRESVV